MGPCRQVSTGSRTESLSLCSPVGLSPKPQAALPTLASLWNTQELAIKKPELEERISVLLLTKAGSLDKPFNFSELPYPCL